MQQEKSRISREEVPHRVLILDDEPLIRWAVCSTLAGAGFEVLQASDVAGARAVASRTPLSLALLDIRLPDGDGVALMKEIWGGQPDCRFIVMTALRPPELTDPVVWKRVQVLDKPFGMPDLLRVVDTVLALRA